MRTLGILVVLLAVLPDGFPTRLDELKLGGKSCKINISSLHQLYTYRAPEKLRNPIRQKVLFLFVHSKEYDLLQICIYTGDADFFLNKHVV